MSNHHHHSRLSDYGSAFYCAMAIIVLIPFSLLLKYKYKRYVGIHFDNFCPKGTCGGLALAICYFPPKCACPLAGSPEPENPEPDSPLSGPSHYFNMQGYLFNSQH